MEEKEFLSGEAHEAALLPAQPVADDQPADEAPSAPDQTQVTDAPTEENMNTEAAEAAAEENAEGPVVIDMVPEVPRPDWSFGADMADEVAHHNKRGIKTFFAIFGGLFCICILLLGLTFWLGDAGFEIIRNVYYDRTVYIREDGTVVGTYTPGEVVEQVGGSTVTISVKTALGGGFGSGFIYSEQGHIITNYHVIETADTVQVTLNSGKTLDATVVGFNEAADVAVLKINADEALIPVKLGNSDAVLVGETVVAIGTPAELDYAGTATFGKISATRRLVSFSNSDGTVTKKMNVLQTDTSVNPGNSGGPLCNLDGEVIGVVVMKVSTQGSDVYEGLGFALPINGVSEIVGEIIQKGSFTGSNPIAEGRSLLGITGYAVAPGYWYRVNANGSIDVSTAEQAGFTAATERGVRVITIESDSDAFGHILQGDIITRVNGLYVGSTVELIETVNRFHAGETVTLTVVRGETELAVDVRLAEEPLT